GYRIDRLFVDVFMAGSALAGLGGAMIALYRGQVHATIGGEFLVLCFIVMIIGGQGSVGGSFVASFLVALIANHTGFFLRRSSPSSPTFRLWSSCSCGARAATIR